MPQNLYLKSVNDETLKISINGELIRIKVNQDPLPIITGLTEVSNAMNLSSVGLFAQKNGTILEFKGLQAGAGISLVPSSTGVTIINTVTGITGFVTQTDFDSYTASTKITLDDIGQDIIFLSGVTNTKLDSSIFNGFTGTTAPATYLTKSAFNVYSGATLTNINSRLLTSAFNTYSGATLTNINSRLLTSAFNTYSAATLTNINSRLLKTDFNTYSGATATAIGNKLNISVFNAYTGTSAPILNTAVTGGTSLGGEPVFKQKTGRNLEFKGLVAGSNITLTPSATGVTIASTGGGGGGSITGGTNVGSTGQGVYKGVNGANLEFKKIKVGLPLNISGDTNQVHITYTGVTQAQINTYTGTTAPAQFQSHSSIVTLTGTTLPTTYALKSNFNTYTGTTAPATYALKSNFNTFTGTTAPATYALKSNFNTYTGTTAPATYALKSNFNTYTGTTAPATYALKTNFNSFTGTTAPATYATKSNFNTFTGTTAPATYATKSNFNTFTGTTAPATYQTKAAFNTYTGSTNTRISTIETNYVTGGTNVGTSASYAIYTGTTAHKNRFKNLVAGSNITITPSTTGLTISSTGGGGGGSYLPLSGGTVTGNVQVNKALSATGITAYSVSGGTGGLSGFYWKDTTSGYNRFRISRSTNENQLNFISYNNSGVANVTNMVIYRDVSQVEFPYGVRVYGTPISLTGATTLTAAHASAIVECNGTFTVTLPNSMNTGMNVTIVNIGTGVITIAASTTLQSKFSNTKLSAQYAAATAYHAGSNVWRLFGDLNA